MARKKSTKSAIDSLREVLDSVSSLKKPDQVWVFRAALDKLQLQVGGTEGGRASEGGSGPDTEGQGDESPGNRGTQASAQAFLREKNPKSDAQKVACFAYYLTHHKNTPEFKTADIQDVETKSKIPKITNMPRAVDNATRASRVLTTTQGGLKQLTTLGEDVVNAMPDQDAVREVLKGHRGGRKRGRRTGRKRVSKRA